MGAADRPKRDPIKTKKDPTAPPPPPAQRPTGSWAPSRVLTKASGVVNADIRAFLSICMTGWDNYTVDEQREIIDTLPEARRFYIDNPETGKLACPLDAEFLATDTYLKRAISRFKTDVSDGNYTASWQHKARQAMTERSEGRFDEYMKQHTEDLFGGDEGSSTSGLTAEDATESKRLDREDTLGPSLGEASSDGEWDPSAKEDGSRSRKPGYKRKTLHAHDSSPDPIQAPSTLSRTATPMDLVADQVPP